MRVVLLAQTQVNWGALEKMGYDPRVGGAYADELAEAAGRLCYKSWDRPNPKTATNEGYLAHILEVAHFSVLRHASASFWISGVSRALTHELVRHDFIDPSQVSQRYVPQDEVEFVVPPVLEPYLSDLVEEETQESIADRIRWHHEDSKNLYVQLNELLRSKGHDHKEARGAARSVLPEGTATELVATGNHQAWREFIQKRNSKFADQEIRELAQALLVELRLIAPNTYQDMEI